MRLLVASLLAANCAAGVPSFLSAADVAAAQAAADRGYSAARSGGQRAQDTEMRLTVSLGAMWRQDAVPVDFVRSSTCSQCGGEGGMGRHACPNCGGTGQVEVVQRHFNTVQRFRTRCSHCGGSGGAHANVCPLCRGSGQSQEHAQ